MAQVVFYCQHLTGIGHVVRSREIVRALARRHDVCFVVGGRPVPGDGGPETFEIVRLPPMFRSGDGLGPVEPGRDLASTLEERRERLEETIRDRRPDVLCIEHFPFSKWALAAELMPAIEAARAANPEVRIVCSVRDIAKASGFDASAQSPIRDTADAIQILNRSFDVILVHGDPHVMRLESHLEWTSSITVPIIYTGYVSQRLDRDRWNDRGARPPGSFVLVSAGGGVEAMDVAGPAIDGWRICRERDWIGDRDLVVFTGPYVNPEEARDLRRKGADPAIHVLESTENLLPWMDAADLSISRAGYNTSANVLETGSRSILIPSPRMSDQRIRARVLAERGLAVLIEPEDVTPERVADAIRSAVSTAIPAHGIDLDGAEKTCVVVDGFT